MTVYHGSYTEVGKPDILHSRREVDFGAGFYTTPIKEQAENWCKKFVKRGKVGVVSVYEFDEAAYDECLVKRFDTYSEEWLEFVSLCRSGKDESEFDIVTGGVANDKVFDTVELYFAGLIGKEEATGRLAMEKPNMQTCFRTQGAIDRYLKFEGSYEI